MRYSFSRIETYQKCPYLFSLKYIGELDTLPNWDSADNALILGSAMHHAIEKGVGEGVREYMMSYPVATSEMVTEAMKIEVLAPKVRAMINPDATFEFEIKTPDFLGYVDYIDRETKTLLDFKYSNNVEHYLSSPQVHLYRYYLELLYGISIDRIGYLFIPKVKLNRKAYETEQMYRNALLEELEKAKPEVMYVTYDANKTNKILKTMREIETVDFFPRKESRLCFFCDFEKYCKSNGKEDYMTLPKNERRKAGTTRRFRLWIYGAPFSGKTTLADEFPDVLMLNTDGRTNFVTAPVVSISEKVEADGHIVRRTPAWQIFKDTIDELSKNENTFKSIVVDLVEDTYEACRLYMYQKLGISHESDSSFKAWDMVRTEFLSTMKKLVNLDYENIVLISHEDTSKDIIKRTGDTISTIRPNIQEKVANKLAGMVDAVMRCVVIDDEHKLQLKADETMFGGGRIDFVKKEIPCSYDAIVRLYEMSLSSATSAKEDVKPVREAPEAETTACAPNASDSTQWTPDQGLKGEVDVETVREMADMSTEDNTTPAIEETVEEIVPRRRRRERRRNI